MNIQIFGSRKSFDSKKAERYFKERGIKYQFIDMNEKGMSKGEFNSVCQAVGGLTSLSTFCTTFQLTNTTSDDKIQYVCRTVLVKVLI